MLDIGLDIDGVLYPFDEQLEQHCIWNNIPYEFNLDRYDFFAPFWSRERFVEVCKVATEEHGLYTSGVYPDAREFMYNLHRAGHKIHLVTNRFLAGGHLDKLVTIQWLNRYDLPYHSLTVTKDKRVVDVDIFLDDYIYNYDQLDEAGVDVWLMNRSYNQEDDNRRRVNTLSDFYNLVELKTIAKSIEL